MTLPTRASAPLRRTRSVRDVTPSRSRSTLKKNRRRETRRCCRQNLRLPPLRPVQRFIRADTALRAAADMMRVRAVSSRTDRRMARRRCDNRSSGNVRSIAMISTRRRLRVTSALGPRGRGDGPSEMRCFGIRHCTEVANGVMTSFRQSGRRVQLLKRIPLITEISHF